MAAHTIHTDQEIIAAGFAIRATAKEPTRASLHRQLQHRGVSERAWQIWLAYINGSAEGSASLNGLVSSPAPEPVSPEMAKARQAFGAAFDAVTATAVLEAQAPLMAKIGALTKALMESERDSRNKDELISDLEKLVGNLREQIARQVTPKSSLILRP